MQVAASVLLRSASMLRSPLATAYSLTKPIELVCNKVDLAQVTQVLTHT